MAVKKKAKPAEKQTFLRPEHRLELLEAINKARDVCNDSLECGAPRTDDAHSAQDKLRSIAHKLGYKQENWCVEFTL
jgi:hypothetical protein